MHKPYPKTDVRALKQIPLLSILAARGVALQARGKDWVGRCPFHDDRTPSFVVSPAKNLWHCLGACGEGGDVIRFVEKAEKMNFIEAVKFLKKNYSVEPGGRSMQTATASVAEEPEDQNIMDPAVQKALRMAVESYRRNLREQTAPVEYLMRRGLKFSEVIEDFQVGFCDGSLLKKISAEAPEVSLLRGIGLLKGQRELFSGCLIFPVVDQNGMISEVYARSIDPAAEVKHLYLPGPHRGIFNPAALISKEVILCESVIDAVSLLCLGHRNVTCSFGVNGLTTDLLDGFADAGTERVLLCYDADRAGERGSQKVAEALRELGIASARISLPCKDANDLLRKYENAGEIFSECLRNAVPFFSETPTGPVAEITDKSEEKPASFWQRVGAEIHFFFGERNYVLRGLESNKSNTSLKVFLKLSYNNTFHIDNNLDLFNAKASGSFTRLAAKQCQIEERTLRGDVEKITAQCDQLLSRTLQEENREQPKENFKVNLALLQKAEAFSRDPMAVVNFCEDVEKCGLVGEPLNAFFHYIATLSRHLEEQLHIIIQSESSSGKSTLLNLIAEFVPEEDKLYFTQVTPKSFYYSSSGSMKNKCIFLAESAALDEAEYPIKQMMSEKRLVITYTTTDPKTGEFKTLQQENTGPAQFSITFPLEAMNEEIGNRSVIITLDESLAQTERIMAMQRLIHSPEGFALLKKKAEIADFYRHLQRALKIKAVENGYAKYLQFQATSQRARRDHKKYLTLIDCITLFFQNQREVILKDGEKTVRTHIIDIALAHFMAVRIFSKALDELPPQTRNFCTKVARHFLHFAKDKNMEFDQVWFYRKDLREISGLSNTRVHEHVNRMLSYEYLTCRRDANGLAYRFLFQPELAGDFRGILKLARLEDLLKRASRKEREEYQSFLPSLYKIFQILDPQYTGEKA